MPVQFDFVWSTCYFSVYPVSLSCLDVLIKYYYLSLYPRLRVPVPPSCVHRDRRPDHNRKRLHLILFSVFQESFILFLFVCLAARKSSLVIPALARVCGVGVQRDCRESAGREPSCPPIVGDIRRRLWLSQARWLVA